MKKTKPKYKVGDKVIYSIPGIGACWGPIKQVHPDTKTGHMYSVKVNGLMCVYRTEDELTLLK